ncbi:MAG: hypothetical protein JOZ84_15780 [Methylobacteriaceae bacterium]|nr:hypothetical protein [Methylobacteriaceae bacterium]
MTKWISLLSTVSSLALANVTFSNVAFADATLRTTACSTLSKVSYSGRDYAIRNYAVRHNLEWTNATEEFDLQLHEQLSDTFPGFATIVRNLVRNTKGADGREVSGSETAEVLGLYGTNPGPVVAPARAYEYQWGSNDEGTRTDKVDGKVAGRYRVIKREISDEVELIQQFLLQAPETGGLVTKSEETSCFRFKQPRWMWSQLVPAPLETVAAGFDPVMYAADNAWTQLKECQAAKGSCDSLEKTYRKAVEVRDKVWTDDTAILQLRDVGRQAGARGFALARFPEDVPVDEQGWLVLDQGSGYLDHDGRKTTAEHLIAPGEAFHNILHQQQLLADGAASQARDETGPAKPETAPQSVALEKPAQAPPQVQPQATHTPATREAAARPTHKRHHPARLEARSSDDGRHGRRTVARRGPADRTQPIPQVSPLARLEPRIRVFSRVARGPDDDFGAPIVRLLPSPLEPPQSYEVRVRRNVSPFYFLFEH